MIRLLNGGIVFVRILKWAHSHGNLLRYYNLLSFYNTWVVETARKNKSKLTFHALEQASNVIVDKQAINYAVVPYR